VVGEDSGNAVITHKFESVFASASLAPVDQKKPSGQLSHEYPKLMCNHQYHLLDIATLYPYNRIVKIYAFNIF
jgi:hypothetical protein